MDFDEWPEQLRDVWENSTFDLNGEEYQEFREYAMEFFEEGWMDRDLDAETRELAREYFFEMMEEFSLDISNFDWDDWRDWYESAA